MNVYACLVCGKYFQGRGPSTLAFTHALEVGHQMYMKLDTGKVRNLRALQWTYVMYYWAAAHLSARA